MKKLLTAGLVLAIAAASLASAAYVHVRSVLDAPLAVPEGGITLNIPAGTPFSGVGRRLETQGLLDDDLVLRWYARWTGQASNIHAGEYRIAVGTTARELLDQLTSGDVLLYAFTIVEGWNHREMLQALHAHPEVSPTMTDEDWPAVLSELGSAVASPEGLFLPETYRFPQGSTDRTVLAEAYRLMQRTLDEEWAGRAPDTPVEDPYEALILASIVEKETARADERQRIAGVFARRLERGMRLQTDPTVIYGIGPAFDGNLTRRHLQTDTPYNTYTRHGLPPTPIAMPGRDAIHAALHPAEGDELFFVATGLGDGSHKFSRTIEEHEAAVQEYLKRLRSSRNRGGSQ